MRDLLKLYGIFLMLFLFACGETPKKETAEETEQDATEVSDPGNATSKTILFFGNSLTAGMGLDPQQAFPALIQSRLDSMGYDYRVINAGLSGETTASGKSRLSWVLRQNVSVFVLELGANDGLRGIPLSETRNNLQQIIDEVRQKSPGAVIVLAGMEIPPNMGPEYTGEFRRVFTDLARENNLALIPFLLQGVAGIPELNQEDGIHPTARGQQIVAENVWEVLEDIVQQ